MSSITLQVPESYCPSKFYTSSDPKEIAIALSLGEAAFEALNGKAVALARSQTHLEAVASVSADFSKQIEVIQNERTTELKRLTQEKLRLEETCKAVQARLEALETQQSLSRAQVQKETKESYQELLLNKEKQIENLQQTLERQMEGMGMKMEALHNSITRTFASSKEKGSFGEILIEGMLKKAFDCDIHIISKDSQTADIRMVRVGTTQAITEYLWEVKNYTRTLTAEEVEKFRRDMRLHPEVRGGFLASLRTGIVGKSRGGDIDIEFLEDGRFVVFLSNLMMREDIVFYLQTLRPLLQVIEQMAKPVQTETDMVRSLQTKAAIITNLLRSHATSIAKHKNSLVAHRKRNDQMFAEFQAYLMESDTQLQNVLRIAIGTEEESDEIMKDSETYLPPLVFQKERLSDLEGRLRAFAQWLMGSTEVREGTQIKIKDLLDRAKEKGFADKFVRESREELFQPVAWAQRSQYILGLQWK
jgi:hypothetical protein